MTFPVPADASTSVLFMMANSFSAFLVLGLTPLLAEPVSSQCLSIFTPASATVLTLMACGLVLTLLVQRDYRRSSCEHEGEGRRSTSPVSPLLGPGAGGAAGYGAISVEPPAAP